MQGLMMVDLARHQARLPPDVGKPLVYIDYLESAPWNVKPMVDVPRYAGIGAVLVNVAVQVSIDEGFHGRIGLSSLANAASFYEKRCQIISIGFFRTEQTLTYFCIMQVGPG